MDKKIEEIQNPSYDKNLSLDKRLYDFLGKYYINLNGVVPNNNLEITEPHKKEIVDFVLELIQSAHLKWNKEMREMIEKEIEYSKSHHEVVLENWEEDKSDVFKSKSEVRGFLIALDAFKELLEQLEEEK